MAQILQYLTHLFSAEGFPPRWLCGLWTPFHGWLYILADIGIWSAYFTIPVALLYFVRKRTDLPFSNLFWLFAAFILACGTSHLLDAIMFWWPGYRLLGLVDLFTAIISWITVFALLPVIPKALTLKSPQQLEAIVEQRTQELAAAEERYRLVISASHEGIWDWDIEKDERYWNDHMYEILGRKRQGSPLTSEGYFELIHPEDRPRVQDLLKTHLENPDVKYNAEFRLRHADGSYRYCLSRGEAQRDAQGRPIRMTGLITDITERKQAEQALQESEAQFRTLANAIPQPVWMAHPDGHIFWYNQRCYELTGATLEDLEGWGWTKHQHPDHVDRVVSHIKQAFETGEPWEDTFPARDKNGEYRWLLSRAVPLRNAQGQIVRWFGTNTDITELRKAQLELQQTQARLLRTLEGANDGIWEWNLLTNELYWNERIFEMLGLPILPHLSYAFFEALVHPDDLSLLHEGLTAHLEHNEPFQIEFRIRHQSGDYLNLYTRGKAVRDEQGQAVLMAGASTNITPLKKSEQALRLVAQQLEQSNQDLAQFTAVASHDLKAPLRKVRTFYRMMQEEAQAKLSPDASNLLTRADQSLETMQTLITDLLTLSQVSSAPPAIQSVNLQQVLETVQQNLESLIQEKGAILEIGSMTSIEGDETQLVQLLQNLVENGLKYQPVGQVPIIQIHSDCFDGQFCQITVQDNGIGMKPQYAEQIFQPFKRLHGKSSPYQGTGVGLSICRRIAERHHGSISVDSQEGQGSTFRVILPVGSVNEKKLGPSDDKEDLNNQVQT